MEAVDDRTKENLIIKYVKNKNQLGILKANIKRLKDAHFQPDIQYRRVIEREKGFMVRSYRFRSCVGFHGKEEPRLPCGLH